MKTLKIKRLGAVVTVLFLFGVGSATFAQEPPVDPRNPFTGDSWGDFLGGAKAVCADDDIDNDNDGLIEICYLEDLDAVRYQLDGIGRKTTSSGTVMADTTGCPEVEENEMTVEKCRGYELVRDLDFTDPDSYRYPEVNLARYTVADFTKKDDQGWEPIATFTSLFEGNGHTIANLMIKRLSIESEGDVGLIGAAINATLTNIGLLNVKIDASSRRDVGSLVGAPTASVSITNSYATGSVKGAGQIGGLVGSCRNSATTNSYATVRSTSIGREAGGLIADFSSSAITNSYATGSVTANETAGGLGAGSLGGTVISSYATGRVLANRQTGGLSGLQLGGMITNSYWDTDSSGQTDSAGGGLKV